MTARRRVRGADRPDGARPIATAATVSILTRRSAPVGCGNSFMLLAATHEGDRRAGRADRLHLAVHRGWHSGHRWWPWAAVPGPARDAAASCGSRWPRPARPGAAARLGCAGSPSAGSPWPGGRSAAARPGSAVAGRSGVGRSRCRQPGADASAATSLAAPRSTTSGRGVWQRSTASWWRSTRISRSLAASPRARSTSSWMERHSVK
jgi:hypothetical protein